MSNDFENLGKEAEDKLEKGLRKKYKGKLERQLNPKSKSNTNKSYSHAYKQFKREQAGKFHLFYEFLCRKAHKILKVDIKKKDREKVEPFLRLAHFNVKPESVYSLTYLLSLFSFVAAIPIMIIVGLIPGVLLGLAGAIFFLFYIPGYPKSTFIKWRAKASDQLVLSVMYMVIQMERVPNLELAVEFVARHTAPPVSLDFMKVLWDVESKRYPSIQESLESYVETWRDWNDDFIEATHLVEFSLQQKSEKSRKKTLKRATKVVLEGTHQHMLHYARSLQAPMQALHMLGVVLPIMALVMLPLIGAFMGQNIRWYYVAILYNIIFPLLVYYLGRDMLQKRPAGTSKEDSYTYIREKYTRPYIKVGGTKLNIPPIALAIVVGLLIGIPGILYFSHLILSPMGAEALDKALFSVKTLLLSLDLVAALGIGAGTYFFYSVHYLIKIKRKIENIEDQFPSAIFQLANRIKEKVPAEVAFSKVVRNMPKSDISGLFWLIDYNLKKQSSTLKDAIFNKKYGALSYYPSGIIKSSMSVLVDAVKRGPRAAAKSLFSISRYLTDLKRVNNRLKDLMADTTSSMRMQIALFIPLITGLVTSLDMLIVKILRGLGETLGGMTFEGGMSSSAASTATAASQMNVGSELLSIFQFQYMIPAFVFAVIVGVYIIQIVCIISYLLNGITRGYDRIELKYLIGRNLFIATPFYCVVAALASLALTSIVSVMPMVSSMP